VSVRYARRRVAVPLLDAVVVDEKELAMRGYLGMLACRV
jgi:hypothetical protein